MPCRLGLKVSFNFLNLNEMDKIHFIPHFEQFQAKYI